MEMKTDPSRILMSDELRDRLPEELLGTSDKDNHNLLTRFVTAAVTLKEADEPIVGVMVGLENKVDSVRVKIQMPIIDAFCIVKAGPTNVTGVVIELGEQQIKPLIECCDVITIDDMSSDDQLCILSLFFFTHT